MDKRRKQVKRMRKGKREKVKKRAIDEEVNRQWGKNGGRGALGPLTRDNQLR